MKYAHSFVWNISAILSSLTITDRVKFLAIVRYKKAKGYVENYTFFPCLDFI